MTDNEIIKALEICNSLFLRCGNGCPYYDIPYKDGKRCSEIMIDDALDLINRQKADIERLKMMLEALDDAIYPLPFKTDFDKAIETAKTEAIKEFAEKLGEELKNCRAYDGGIRRRIDNLVKEMVGE